MPLNRARKIALGLSASVMPAVLLIPGVPSGWALAVDLCDGINVAGTEWLAKQGVVHFGIDSMRPGPEGKVNSLVHKACLELDITHLESLCNLEELIGKGEFRFICLPLKWREGTGSPIRAVAIFDEP